MGLPGHLVALAALLGTKMAGPILAAAAAVLVGLVDLVLLLLDTQIFMLRQLQLLARPPTPYLAATAFTPGPDQGALHSNGSLCSN
jgi:hypothetical protein